MRKNKIVGKNLNLYITYKITGLNLDNLVNILKNKGIFLTDIIKRDAKTMIVSVNYADNEKFFAITRDLCYNIKKVGEKGKYRFALSLIRNIGLFVGAIIFAVSAAFIDDFIFSIDYYGSGSAYAREVEAYLNSQNVKPFSRFSDFDLPNLSDGILASSYNLSFAECVKEGNRLKINLVLSETPVKALDGDKEVIVSDIDGEIEYIKIYRGTALKSVGEKVKKGEAILSGFAVVKDTTVKVGIIATVAVKCEYIYDYTSEKEDDEEAAEIFAEISFGEGKIITSATEKTVRADGKYDYKVKIIYRRILCG